jgi:hypothetical protein
MLNKKKKSVKDQVLNTSEVSVKATVKNKKNDTQFPIPSSSHYSVPLHKISDPSSTMKTHFFLGSHSNPTG